MSMLSQFARRAPNRVFFSVVLGTVAGLAYAALIPTMLAAVAPQVSELVPVQSAPSTVFGYEIAHARTAALFAGLCALIWICRTLSQTLLLKVSIEAARDLRMAVYGTVARASVARLEQVGLERIGMVLNVDIAKVVAGARMSPDLLIHGITVLGILSFLLYLNSSVFWFTLAVMTIGGITYQLPVWYANRFFRQARQQADRRAEGVMGLVHGAKELKLNRLKREHFFKQELEHNETVIGQLDNKGGAIVRAAVSYGDLINLIAVGAVAFVLVNYRAIGQNELMGVVMALLYLTAPVAAILNGIPLLMQAANSSRTIDALCAELPAEAIAGQGAPAGPWTSIRFRAVTYAHAAASDGRQFSVGPLDFSLARGQVTFIVGGNGSGKSTIAKLITLHYAAQTGTICFDDVEVDAGQMAAYREQVASIYSDYHLFDQLFGVAEHEMAKVDGYLAQLDLQHKVSIDNGRFSTLRLSDGQRRRLALLGAFLEDRSLYLFDEWAADQDPEFKAFFYENLLPQLRARGKCVVVISHDERYFHLADQLLFVENGQVRTKGP